VPALRKPLLEPCFSFREVGIRNANLLKTEPPRPALDLRG
jgi:hypothetical protein